MKDVFPPQESPINITLKTCPTGTCVDAGITSQFCPTMAVHHMQIEDIYLDRRNNQVYFTLSYIYTLNFKACILIIFKKATWIVMHVHVET